MTCLRLHSKCEPNRDKVRISGEPFSACNKTWLGVLLLEGQTEIRFPRQLGLRQTPSAWEAAGGPGGRFGVGASEWLSVCQCREVSGAGKRALREHSQEEQPGAKSHVRGHHREARTGTQVSQNPRRGGEKPIHSLFSAPALLGTGWSSLPPGC